MQGVVLAALMTVLGTGLRPLCAGINAWTSVGPEVGMIVSLSGPTSPRHRVCGDWQLNAIQDHGCGSKLDRGQLRAWGSSGD